EFFYSSRRRHTRWPRDWSSDVCSSDLTRWASTPFADGSVAANGVDAQRVAAAGGHHPRPGVRTNGRARCASEFRVAGTAHQDVEIGRASSRKREKTRVADGALKEKEDR